MEGLVNQIHEDAARGYALRNSEDKESAFSMWLNTRYDWQSFRDILNAADDPIDEIFPVLRDAFYTAWHKRDGEVGCLREASFRLIEEVSRHLRDGPSHANTPRLKVGLRHAHKALQRAEVEIA
jgi:hypothetical protein